MRMIASLCVAFALALCSAAYADDVRPNDNVTSGVVIRAEPTAASARLGVMRPGDRLPLTGEAPGWWQVELEDGRTGFVTKRWTLRIETPDAPEPGALTQSFRMHVIDVGTGLAIFLEGEDFTLVYDGGSNDDRRTGVNNRVLAYLRAVRPDLQIIDHLILSHPHRDHVELLPDIFDAYEVREVWDSGAVNPTCGYRFFIERVRDEGSAIYHNALADEEEHLARFNAGCGGRPAETLSIAAGPRIDDEPVDLGVAAQMTFLHVDGSPHSDPNENSLVVRLDLGAQRILLTGDAEAGGREQPPTAPTPGTIEAILLACCRSELAADILVVGHHGSLTSSRTAFLDAIEADDFIISSGPFAYQTRVLPDAEVLAELQARGRVWSTALEDGQCRTNPAKIGSDADDRAGGCDNIRVDITPSGAAVAYWRGSD